MKKLSLINIDERNVAAAMEERHLLEKMSVSEDVDTMTDGIIEYLSGLFGPENRKHTMNLLETTTASNGINDIPCELWVFKNDQIASVKGHRCLMDVKFINIVGDIDDDVYSDFIQSFANANIGSSMAAEGDDDPVTIEFELHATVILRNWEFTEETLYSLSHELRHAYIKHVVYGNKTKKEAIGTVNMKWESIYNAANNYIHLCANVENTNPMGLGTELYTIFYAIYCCDKEEVGCFTQESYQKLKVCKTVQEVKKKIKTTHLWEALRALREAKEYLESGYPYEEIISKLGGEKVMPTKHALLKLISHRHNEIADRIGRVQTTIIDRINGEKKVFYTKRND